eukprot:3656174-Prymnesium_polylepis.1
MPLVWAKAGLFLAIVQLKSQGELDRAAALAVRGAESACDALGDDSSVFLKFSSLAEAFGRPLPPPPP